MFKCRCVPSEIVSITPNNMNMYMNTAIGMFEQMESENALHRRNDYCIDNC